MPWPPNSLRHPFPVAVPVPAWPSRTHKPDLVASGVVHGLVLRLRNALPWRVVQHLNTLPEPLRRRWLPDPATDAGHGACWLGRPDIARCMETALLQDDGNRYRLLAWCILPNHVHALIQPLEPSAAEIVARWQGTVTRDANRILGRTGPLWQPGATDQVIEDPHRLRSAIRHIEQHPIEDGLVRRPDPRAWPWGSARLRA